MADADKSQKTEKPTPKRKKDARERGQVAKSQDLGTWITLMLTTVLLQTTVRRGATEMRALMSQLGEAISNPDSARAWRFMGAGLKAWITIAAPIVLGLMVTGLLVNIAQVGLRPSWKVLKPDFKRLNAAKGIKRMFSGSAAWELVKALVKVAVLMLVAWPTVSAAAQRLASRGGSMFSIAATASGTALTLLRNVSAVGLVIAAIDYGVQKRRIVKQLMMTRQELIDEHKQNEGDPKVRAAIRSRQQAMTRNRMLTMVGRADVVVVNPTHFAVALRYDPTRGAPEVLAKGADHLAAKIRLEATRHDIPIVHEPTLARALYRTAKPGQLIPFELYEAVAHLLAFLFSLRQKGRASGYHELGRQLVPGEPVPV